jgi:hypothetical protein
MAPHEKDLEASHQERVLSSSSNEDASSNSGNALPQGPEKEDEETRRLVRKIDLRLLPTLAVIYAFALIDRVNLPNVSPYGAYPSVFQI